MRKTVAKGLILSLLVMQFGGVERLSAAKGKEPALAKNSITLYKGATKKVAAKRVTKKMKVLIRQSKASKKKVKVKWIKRSGRLQVTAKRKGTAIVKVCFRVSQKEYTSKLKITIKNKTKPDSAAPQASETVRSENTPAPSANGAAQSTVSAETTAPADNTAVPVESVPAESTAAAATQTAVMTTAEPTLSPTPLPTYVADYAGDTELPMKEVYADYFMMGAAINGNTLDTMALNHAGMAGVLKKHFNSTVMSNLMKPEYLLDKEASQASGDGMPVCRFDSCDSALQFCLDNGIKMRGHTLVWHNQVPEWFFYEDYDTEKNVVDAETMDKRLESYIRQVLTHCQQNFPGVIYCWDVVNECVSVDDGSYIVTSGGWKLRAATKEDNDFTHEDYQKNYWYAVMGESYVEKAFAYARKYADPDVKLFYNDYNVFLTEKMNNIYKLAEELKEKGLIDGIGLQPTVLYNWPELNTDNEGSFKTCLEKYAELGLELQITELSFKITNLTEANLQKQADRYEEMMRLLMAEDTHSGGPCNITSVTVFGICDDYPLYTSSKQNLYLWDKNCMPKACFYSFLKPGLEALQAAGQEE